MIQLVSLPRLKKFKEFDGHQSVFLINDERAGLRGFIAIHNTNRGNAIGGTRYFVYKDEDEALSDALNLSRAMTYKCAIAGVKQGGGKAVIIARKSGKTAGLIDSYARAVNDLNGLFRTGEDVGIDEDDVLRMAKVSPYILGLPNNAGDPSPWAAMSVFYSIEIALLHRFGSDSIKGRSFAIKGVGKVGAELLRLIYERGGVVTTADINKNKIDKLSDRFKKIKIVSSEEIFKVKADVYAPCAMGGEFSSKNMAEINCEIVCGSANNQLADRCAGGELYERGIVYVPDYLANAGGLINVADELNFGGYNKKRVFGGVREIKETVRTILSLSKKEKRPTNEISDKFAEDVFRAKMQ